MKAAPALQLSRIVVLLLLLRVRVQPAGPREMGANLDVVVRASLAVSLISLLFVVVLLVGRQRRHPWAVLAVEALAASALAFVPPVMWVVWFGISGWTNALVEGPAQPLAAAWLGVVVLRGFQQLRSADSPTSTGSTEAAETTSKA